ncbi:MAG: hypothetical protein K2J02_01565 [Malacoplasma sp.]|nr:hypothetical protein [Malacoplasma sp.]MDE6894042.1 hypothetical protein [Malacoplasma sp.]
MSEILSIQKEIKNNDSNFKKYYEDTLDQLNKNKKLNAFLSLVKNYQYVKNNPSSNLNKILYAVKDNINVRDTITTGGSLFFENYKSPYSASVIKLLDDAGAIPICKTNLDEFGLGGTGLFSAYGDVLNPIDESRIAGGSSSGSAVLVAKKIVAFALGTDTGDSIRMPASFLGVYGYKPSYGLVSRFGVFPYSPSIDHVGVFANSVADVAIVMDVINQHDKKDFTSQITKIDFYQNINNFDKKTKIVYFSNIVDLLNQEEKKLFLNTIEKIGKNSIIHKETYPVDLLHLIPVVYEILSYSEAVSCYQNITGVPFGKKGVGKTFEEKIIDVRSKSFGKELKRRFVLGSYVTLKENEDILLKCKKIRRLIVEKINDIFKKYDFIVMPGAGSIAPKVKDVKENKFKSTEADNYLQIANFGGFPSFTIPMGKIQNMPIGINVMGKINSDAKLVAFTNMIDKLIKGEK